MIPKLIHLVWFGGPRPRFFDKTVDLIKSINYDYEIKEWDDNNIDFDLINRELFDKTENYGSKSDIFRFEVLNKYGGIYMDYDFLQLKKFDSVLDTDFFVSAGMENEVWNSIVGSKSNNPICGAFLNGLKNNEPVINDNNAIVNTMNKTGPYYLEKIFNNTKHLCDYSYLSKNTFFPFPAVLRDSIKILDDETLNFIKSYSTKETIAIHFHTCTWQH